MAVIEPHAWRQCAERGHRCLLALPQSHLHDPALLVQLGLDPGLPRLSRNPEPPTDAADRIGRWLGQEHPALLVSWQPCLDPRELAAACGTLCAGGLLILALPEAAFIPSPHASLASARTALGRTRWPGSAQRFHRILLRHTHSDPGRQSIRWLNPACIDTDASGDRPLPSHSAWPVHVHDEAHEWVHEQSTCLDRLVRNLQQIRHDCPCRVTLLQGPRGRGKSALLGRLVGALSDVRTFGLTSAHPSACRVLLAHATGLPEAGIRPTASSPPARELVQHQSLDTVLRNQFDVLIVEEAGHVPLPILLALAGQCRHLILATTTHGYEGSGRAFALRLPTLLKQNGHVVNRIELQHPIRWRRDDPLERWLNETYLLADDGISDSATGPISVDPMPDGTRAPMLVDAGTLLADEVLLHAVYSLLSQAHYRTSPIDLHHMLDQTALLTFVWPGKGQIQAAALVALEGELPHSMQAAIHARERRPAHQLLPQLLSQCTLLSNLSAERYARIVRIAVRETHRRQGTGRALIAGLRTHPVLQGRLLGASFGAQPGLLDFWTNSGFLPFHRGFRRNPRSGLYSVAVLDSHEARAHAWLATATALLADNLQALTSCEAHEAQGSRALHRLDRACDSRLQEALESAADALGHSPSCPEDRQVLAAFAEGKRSAIDSAAALLRLSRIPAWRNRREKTLEFLPEQGLERASENELIRLDAAWLVGRTPSGSPGKRASRRRQEQWLRQSVSAWLASPH